MTKAGWSFVGGIVVIVATGYFFTRIWGRYVRQHYVETTALVTQAYPKELDAFSDRWGRPIRRFQVDMTVQYVVDGRTNQQQLVYPKRFLPSHTIRVLYRKDDPGRCMLAD